MSAPAVAPSTEDMAERYKRVISVCNGARERWLRTARDKQIPPPGDWDLLLWVAGRFFGKTRCLVEHGWYEAARLPIIVHALAPTIGDVRRTLMEGESGFLRKIPRELIGGYNRSLHELTLVGGSKIIGFSATEEADRLRGPQCHLLLFDEAAAADRPAGNLETAYKVASLGCRLPYPDGRTPSRKLIATTPKPIAFLKNLMRRPGAIVVRGTSYENIRNVSKSVMSEVLALEGTQFGRQEIMGEVLEESELAIFKKSWFRLWPKNKKFPEFLFILVSVDPAVSEHDYNAKKQTRDPTGIGVFGIFNTKQCFTEKELKALGVRSKYAAVLCDLQIEMLGFPELLERLRKVHRTKYGSPGRRPDVILIEAEKTGISLRQALAKYSVPTWPFSPHGQSKTMRAHVASPLILQGMFFLPESGLPDRQGEPRDWAQPVIDQLCAFAGEGSVEHDEVVDLTSQAMIYLSERGFFNAVPLGRGFPDADEIEEQKQRDAIAIADREKRGSYSPYGS